MFAGLGAARIRRLFAEARKHRPAIVFIDEIDAVGARARLGQQLRARADAQPAARRDGRLRARTGDLVVIAASNLLEKLDPALLRPGRFDRQIFVSPPDVAGREAILKVHTRDKPLGDVDLDADRAPDRGPDRRRPGQHLQRGGDLRRPRAPRRASSRRTSTPRSSASSPACSRAARSTSTSAASSPSTRPATRCAPSCCPASTARTRSRSSRAAARSATRCNLPEEDRYLKTREELIDHMAVLLGGRAAEEIVFGAITTGASDDLAARRRDLALDDPRVRDGHVDQRAPALRRGRRGVRPHAPAARRGAAAPRRRGDARARSRLHHRAPRQARRSSRARCCATRCSSARTSTASWTASRAAGASPPGRPAGRRRRADGRPDSGS